MKLAKLKEINIIGIAFFIAIFNVNPTFSQIQKNYLSEKWSGNGGTGTIFSKFKVLEDMHSNSYISGNTINDQYADILIQKRSSLGNLLWSIEYPGTPINLPINPPVLMDIKNGGGANNTKIYVLSTHYDTLTTETKMIIKKIDASGSIDWTYTHSSSFVSNVNDMGTAIKQHEGSIYVTGISISDTSMTDFLTFSLNENLGTLNWEKRYDHNNLQDYPAKIICKAGSVFITGASQDSTSSLSWSIATVSYNTVNGAEIAVNRINNNSISGVNNISDLYYHNENIYIVGSKLGDTTNLDMAIYKLDSDLNLVWENFYDFNGLNDHANSIQVDVNDNIYITGYSTKQSIGKEISILKCNSDGTLIWKKEITGAGGLDDEGIKLIFRHDDLLFIAANVRNRENYDFGLYMMTSSGMCQITGVKVKL